MKELIQQWLSSLHPGTELGICAHSFALEVDNAHSPWLVAHMSLALLSLVKRYPLDPYGIFGRARAYLPAMMTLREVYKDPAQTLSMPPPPHPLYCLLRNLSLTRKHSC